MLLTNSKHPGCVESLNGVYVRLNQFKFIFTARRYACKRSRLESFRASVCRVHWLNICQY